MGGAGRWRVGVSGGPGPWPPEVLDLLPLCTFPPPGSALDCAVSGGPELLARVWRGPEWLPTLDEIRSPGEWVARAGGALA
jgi:hypothetical protein